MKNEKLEIIESNEFQNLFDKSKKLIDSARSNMAEVFQEAMLLECVNFTWLTKIEKMKLPNRELDNWNRLWELSNRELDN